jgi:IS30 family transposase
MLQKGYKQKQIAEAIGKDKGTVCREIRRNCDARSGAYRQDLAQRKCDKRHQTKPQRIRFTEQEKAYVDTLLKNDFSPEQIAGRAKSEKWNVLAMNAFINMFGLTKKLKVYYLST